MIDITVILTIRNPDDLPTVRSLLAEHGTLSRAEPGCLRFEAYESTTVANTIVLVERWEDQASLDVHRLAPGFTTIYAPKVLPLVNRVAHIGSALLPVVA